MPIDQSIFQPSTKKLQNASSKRTIYTTPSLPRLRDCYGRWRQKECKSQKQWVIKKNCILDTPLKLHTWTHSSWKIGTKQSQTKYQYGEENWSHDSTPRYGAVGNCLLLGEGEIVFSKSVVPSKTTMFQWRTTQPRISVPQNLVLKWKQEVE